MLSGNFATIVLGVDIKKIAILILGSIVICRSSHVALIF